MKLADFWVVSDVDNAAFEGELVQTAQACGVRVGLSHTSGLELEPEVHMREMRAFGSHNMLTVALLRERQDRYGGIAISTYDAKLSRDESSTLLWRAHVQLVHHDEPAVALAHDLLARLNADGVIPRCARLDPPIFDPLMGGGAR